VKFHLSLFSVAVVAWVQPANAEYLRREAVDIPTSDGVAVAAEVFTADTRESRIKVLTSRSVSRGSTSDHGVSVREAANSTQVGSYTIRHALLLNGGFSSNPTSRPAGLLISDGDVVSLANVSVRLADTASACPYARTERLRLSGALCVAPNGRASIRPVDAMDGRECRQALQAGPILVEQSEQVAVCPASPDSQRALRTAICTRGHDVVVVLTTKPITLYDLAVWMAAPPKQRGLGCEAALNLSGDTSSGAVYFPGGIASLTGRVAVGPGSYPLPSLILIHDKRL
jgi:uncharacterized protein YigE (DUF2233 family)